MSLGIDDPVTRDSHKSDNQYLRSLAKQICDILLNPISEMGGMMALADVYCRVNRARGLELLSPEDLLNACKIMENLSLPLKLYQFSSGVMVLQLQSLDDESVATATADLVKKMWLPSPVFVYFLRFCSWMKRARCLVRSSLNYWEYRWFWRKRGFKLQKIWASVAGTTRWRDSDFIQIYF